MLAHRPAIHKSRNSAAQSAGQFHLPRHARMAKAASSSAPAAHSSVMGTAVEKLSEISPLSKE